MINSTTLLIEEILVEQEDLKLQAPALEESLKKRTLIRESKKEYVVRYACMQGRILRSSWIHNLQFLTSLVHEIQGINPLLTLLNTISAVSGKIASYAKTDIATNYVYDRLLKADNRALQLEVVQEANEDDVLWFKTLNQTQQISLVIGLLRIGGGAIMRKMHEVLLNLCKHRTECQQVESSAMVQSDSIIEVKRDISSRLRLLTDYYEAPKYDPKDPLCILVEKERKKFDDMMKNYKASVAIKKPKPEEQDKQKTSKKGGKKDKKKDKKGKKKKEKSKKGKSKNKKSGQKESESLDWIQLLPIWIVKQIFGYFDKSTLATVKKVNKYWEYVVTDMGKEAAARIAMDKKIQKMEENVNQLMLQANGGVLVKNPRSRISITERKMKKLAQEGCTNQKLRIPFIPRLEESVLCSAPKQLDTPYIMSVPLRSFPRNGTKFPCLNRRPTLIYVDWGFLPRAQFDNGEKTEAKLLSIEKEDCRSHQSVGYRSVISDISSE